MRKKGTKLAIVLITALLLMTVLPISLATADQSEGFSQSPNNRIDDVIAEMVADVSKENITNYIQDLQDFGTRYSFTQQCQKAAEYIFDRYNETGELDVEYDWFDYAGYNLRNVIATLPSASTSNDTIYIVGGHYDSISNQPFTDAPGADDDASGTSAAIEAAHILCNYEFRATIKFAAWCAEEQGLVGSKHYATNAKNNGDNIQGYLNYDMIGYDGELNFIYNDESEGLVDKMISVNEKYDIGLVTYKVYDPNMKSSDHASFWDQGYKSFCGIETYFNPYYHTTEDTIDKLTLDLTWKTTQDAVAAIAELAGLMLPPEIEHIPLQDTEDTVGPYRVMATIIDEDLDTDSLFTHYTINDVDFTALLMQPTGNPDEYYADIPGQPEGTTVHYYIEAKDIDGLIATHPQNADPNDVDTLHRFYVGHNQRPIADAGPDQESFDGRTVNFDGSNSYDPDGSIVNWTWDFGDGSFGYGEITSHIYSTHGTYNVKLTVEDDLGAKDTDTAIVTIWQDGHDLSILKVQSPHNVRMGTTKNVIVWVENMGSYGDHGLLSLTITAPDGTETTLTKIVKDRDGTSMNPGTKVKVSFSVNFNQRGTWTFHAHVDLSDSNGTINPFPLKDCNPADNDGEPSYSTSCS